MSWAGPTYISAGNINWQRSIGSALFFLYSLTWTCSRRIYIYYGGAVLHGLDRAWCSTHTLDDFVVNMSGVRAVNPHGCAVLRAKDICLSDVNLSVEKSYFLYNFSKTNFHKKVIFGKIFFYFKIYESLDNIVPGRLKNDINEPLILSILLCCLIEQHKI